MVTPWSTLILLLACVHPIATIPDASRIAELANGMLIVGTQTGELWSLSAWGDAQRLASFSGEIVGLTSDPSGHYFVLMKDGELRRGTVWTDSVLVATGVGGMLQDCEGLHWWGEWESGVTVTALGDDCESRIEGTEQGTIEGIRVSDRPIQTVQWTEQGVLWVDVAGQAGIGQLPFGEVRAAWSVHLAPWVAGEIVWADREGRFWAGR